MLYRLTRFELLFFLFFNTDCIGIKNSKTIGSGMTYLSQPMIQFLSGKLTDKERKTIVAYIEGHKEIINVQKSEDQTLNDNTIIRWLIEKKFQSLTMKQLYLSLLRYNSLCDITKIPWFLQEISLLPFICSCNDTCIIDPLICQNPSYFLSLIDHLERNTHRIETKEEQTMFLESVTFLFTNLEKLRSNNSMSQKRIIDQGLEKLLLIQQIFMIDQANKKVDK